jgi:hypothetical protein
MKKIKLILLTFCLSLTQHCCINAMQQQSKQYYDEKKYPLIKIILGLAPEIYNEKDKTMLGLPTDELENLCANMLEKTIIYYRMAKYYAFDGIDGANQCHINALLILELTRNEWLRNKINYLNIYCEQSLLEHLKKTKVIDDINCTPQLKTSLQILALNLLLSIVSGLGSQKPQLTCMILGITESNKLNGQLKDGGSKLLRYVKHKLIQLKLDYITQKSISLGLPIYLPLYLDDGTKIYPKYPGMLLLREYTQMQSITMLLKIQSEEDPLQWSILAFNTKENIWRSVSIYDIAPVDTDCVIVIHARTSGKINLNVIKDLDPWRTLCAIAANWMLTEQKQKEYAQYILTDKADINIFRSKMNDDLIYARNNSLERENHKTLWIEHIYPDTISHAIDKNENIALPITDNVIKGLILYHQHQLTTEQLWKSLKYTNPFHI